MFVRVTRALMSAVIALAPLPALAQPAGETAGYWHHGWDWGWGHTIFGIVMMVLFWGGVILVIVLGARWLGGGSGQAQTTGQPRNQALDILRERYARGEIDKEEFEERQRLLSD